MTAPNSNEVSLGDVRSRVKASLLGFAIWSFLVYIAPVHAQNSGCKFQASQNGHPATCTALSPTGTCSPSQTGSGSLGICEVVNNEECTCLGTGFSLTAEPTAVIVRQGQSAGSIIALQPLPRFPGSVQLSFSALPAGVIAGFSTSVLDVSHPSTSLTFIADDYAPLTAVAVVVHGTWGSFKADTTIQLQVASAPNAELWGFADLHAHLASFLGFGSDPNGNNGLFWGNPGLNLSDSSSAEKIASYLPQCTNDTHNGYDPDPVRSGTRKTIIQKLDGTLPQWPHGPTTQTATTGQPTFDFWPAALSLEHQQMYVTEIRRAYDGGLRLLFASATDNELIHDLWNTGINILPGNTVPTPTGTYDYETAKKQLAFIQSFAAANSSWMQIVTSAADARKVIRRNKLAVVLSLELDSLWGDQILDLASQFGVRHVIPVHLSDNTIGGSAVYDDLWNSNSFFLTGNFFRVRTNKCVNFSLGYPTHLTQGPLGAIEPAPIDRVWFASLGYPTDVTLGGHENDRGLNMNEFMRLMNAGLLLDVVHMGEKSADGALYLGEHYGYPLMDSHTGLRNDQNCSNLDAGPDARTIVNERSIPYSQVTRISKLGGVLGLGTTPRNTGDDVAKWVIDYDQALGLMGGKGVALGTDTNGLSPQIYNNFYMLPTCYPVKIQASFNDSPADVPQALPQFTLLSKTFDFAKDGLAHYGMLPDFFQAVNDHPDFGAFPCVGRCQSCAASCNASPQGDTNACLQSCQAQFPSTPPSCKPGNNPLLSPSPNTGTALRAVFHSARDVLDMWDKTEKAEAQVPIPENVQCSIFDVDSRGLPINVTNPTDAIYLQQVRDTFTGIASTQACAFDNVLGVSVLTCRKFVGLCKTVNTGSAVKFSIFNDGEQDLKGPLTKVYFAADGTTCISGEPAIAPDGTCRKWFGEATTADARSVACSIFDFGYASPIGKSAAVKVGLLNTDPLGPPVPSLWCLPTGPNGVCKQWFGRCIAWPPTP